MTSTSAPAVDAYATRSEHETWIARREPTVWAGAHAGPLDQPRLDRFDSNGYLELEELLGPAEVHDLRERLTGLCADETLRADERTIVEPTSQEVRSIFEVHKLDDAVAQLIADARVAGVARQLLGSDVYVHQSRVNFKPAFEGREFYWHSDFETWHAEDGMAKMRALSMSISLTDNHSYNGALMIMPGSHKTFVSCAGPTPADNYQKSLRQQEVGTPSQASLAKLHEQHGIDTLTGPAGGATVFDCNCMHGSNGNISPLARSNIFVVFNSVENTCIEPFAAPAPRPEFIAAREFTPLPR